MVVFWPDDYLDQVARQVRVVRIREPLTAELRDHMLSQKEEYLAAGLSEEEAERKIIEGSTIPAGTPVIIKSSSESISLFPSLEAGEPIEGNLLQGTYLDIATPQNGYIFSGVDGELGFYANAREVVPANKAYIVSDEGSPKFLIDFTKTGISSAKANLENAVVYDLQGRRIEKPGKGIYIINGKKVQLK